MNYSISGFGRPSQILSSAGLLFALAAAPMPQVWAQNASYDLKTLYQSATAYDANLAAAKASYQAEQAQEEITEAGLRPNITAAASYGKTDEERGGADSDYDSTNYQISLRQPLFDAVTWYNDTAAERNTLRAESVYRSAEQNLILDVATAYFDVLRAEEDVTVAKALQAAVKRQYEQASEQFDVGLIAITDVHEAKALFDDANTTRIRAEGALTIAKEQLSRITGEFVTDLHELKTDFPTKLDNNFTSEDWVKSAEEFNLQIQAAKFTLENLQAQYKASKAGHYPTLSLNAGYSNTDLSNFSGSNTGGSGNGASDIESTSISLDLNVPIYLGGATQAGVRQTRFSMEQARFQLEAAKRQARIDARTEYINVRTNTQTVDSLQQNIVSRESALEATREGYKVGTRNIVEVLDAERSYYTALRDYASARFDFIESSLRLKQAAGTLSQEDIERLNDWLINIKS